VAAIQVIVYAGAIVVLFLFVIAYLGDRGALGAPDRVGRWRALGIVGVLGLVAQGALLLDRLELPGANDDPRPTDTIGSPEAIGHSFIDDYIVPFEATSLLLLVAAVAAVMLAKKAIQSEGGR
jgi:NADH-quinone oxidoreductase subunit J